MQLVFGTILSILVQIMIVQSHNDHDHGSMTTVKPPMTTASPFNWTHQSKDLKKLVGVEFKWKADDPEWIVMEMSTRTRGYVSVGFCPEWHDSMKDCDIVIGGVDDQSLQGYLIDYYATDNIQPEEDESQDYQLISAQQEEWLTKITFKRKWNTNDPKDANLEKNKVQIIWSWNTEDVKGSSKVIAPHDRNMRGHTKTMISLKSPPNENSLPPNAASRILDSSSFMFLILMSVSFLIF